MNDFVEKVKNIFVNYSLKNLDEKGRAVKSDILGKVSMFYDDRNFITNQSKERKRRDNWWVMSWVGMVKN